MRNGFKKELAACLFLFSLGSILVPIFYMNTVLLTAILALVGLIALKFWHEKKDIQYFFAGFILGPVAEIIATNFGVWYYTNPTFMNIPLWLPFGWGFFALLLRRFADLFAE